MSVSLTICSGCCRKDFCVYMGENMDLCEECLQGFVKDIQEVKRKNQEPCYPGDL